MQSPELSQTTDAPPVGEPVTYNTYKVKQLLLELNQKEKALIDSLWIQDGMRDRIHILEQERLALFLMVAFELIVIAGVLFLFT